MTRINLYFKNGSVFGYKLVSDEKGVFHFQDQDGTSMKLNKDTNEIYSYDGYNKFWKYMKNTTEMLDRAEIIWASKIPIW